MNRITCKTLLDYFLIIALSLYVINFFMANSSIVPAKMGGADSSVFINFGFGWLNGLIPYKDLYDHKGPMLWLINMLAFSLFDNEQGVIVIELLFAFGWGACVLYIFKKNIPLGCFCIFFVYAILLPEIFDGGNFTEEYAILFNVISLAIFFSKVKINYRFFIYGLMGAFCFLLRPNLASPSLALLLIDTFSNLNKHTFFKPYLYAFCGFMAVFLPFILYFWHKGALKSFLYFLLIKNITYSWQGAPLYSSLIARHFIKIEYVWISQLLLLIPFVLLKEFAYFKESLFMYIFCIVCAYISLRPYPHYHMNTIVPYLFTCCLLYRIPYLKYKKLIFKYIMFFALYKKFVIFIFGLIFIFIYLNFSLNLHYNMYTDKMEKKYQGLFNDIGLFHGARILNLGSHADSGIFYLSHSLPGEKFFFPYILNGGPNDPDNVYENIDKILAEKNYDFILKPEEVKINLRQYGFLPVGRFKDSVIYKRIENNKK